MIDRREFLKAAGVLSATTFLPAGMLAQLTADSTIAIRLQAAASEKDSPRNSRVAERAAST